MYWYFIEFFILCHCTLFVNKYVLKERKVENQSADVVDEAIVYSRLTTVPSVRNLRLSEAIVVSVACTLLYTRFIRNIVVEI